MGFVDFTVWVDQESVRKLNLEQFIPMQIWFGKDFIGYLESKNRKFLVSLVGKEITDLKDGTSYFTLVITEVLYVEVNERKRFIVYDARKKILEYTDDPEPEHRMLSGSAKIFSVIPLFYKVGDAVLDAILQNEERTKK